jgi:D-arabinitol 4-dehydrogenase
MDQIATILHLGQGSFHRAHQAVYLQNLFDLGETEGGETGWLLAGGNIRPDMQVTEAHLIAQNGRYTLETVTPTGLRAYQTIDAISQVIPWEQNLRGLIARGARPDTKIISFTVTEAGYYLTPQNRLDTSFPDLASDLAQGTMLTIYGALAAILDARMQTGAGPVTLLSCDNLRGNGERSRAGLEEFLRLRGATALLDWVTRHTTSPNAMVDRITPRPSAEMVARVQRVRGWPDACPIMAEHFIQWVVEDHFAAGRPAWEKVGVEMVESVLPYEEAKIRILNASHSAIAWAGTLRGMSYIHEGALDPEIAKIAHDYVTNDVLPCLTDNPLDLFRYRDAVLERFTNADIQDTNQRVAADGYSKIPGFLVPTFQERLDAGASIESVAMLPALFFVFLQHWAAGEVPYAYQDQAMDEPATSRMLAAPDALKIFGRDRLLWGGLAGDARLEAALERAHHRVLAWLQTKQPGV